MISLLEYASRMPALSLSRQASRDFDNVRVQVEALVSNFNASVMDVLGKYHQSTLEHCNVQLGAVKTQLADQQKEFQKELDYRNGVILRLEKERNEVVLKLEREKHDLKTEMENRIQEARKLVNFERLDLRPSPTYNISACQVQSEPECSQSPQPKDLESVIFRLKNKHKVPRQMPRRRHTHDVTPEPETCSVLARAEHVPDLIPVANGNERVADVKLEFDVDENYVDVLHEEVKVDEPSPTEPIGEAFDIVDEADSNGERVPSQPPAAVPSTSQTDTDRTSETSQEPTNSETSSDGERPTNNNDSTFVNRQSANQLSLPLKKRKPPAKKRQQAKTPEPLEKLKLRRVKTPRSLDARTRSAPSVAISEDEITALPASAKAMKRKRAASVQIESMDRASPPARRSTKTSRAARDEAGSDLEDNEVTFNTKSVPDPSEQIMEIGIVHASNTPILSQPSPQCSKSKAEAVEDDNNKSAKTSSKVKKRQVVNYACTKCTQRFTVKSEFQKHVQSHAAKKRRISAPAVVENATAEEVPAEVAVVAMATEVAAVIPAEVAAVVPAEVATEVAAEVAAEVAPVAGKKKSGGGAAKEGDRSEKSGKKRERGKRREAQAKTVKTAAAAAKNVVVEEPVVVHQPDKVEQEEEEKPKMDVDLPEDAPADEGVKIEANGRDTPASLSRDTPPSVGDSLGRNTPTSRAKRGYQGPIHRCIDCPATFKFKYCLDNHRGVHTQKHNHKCRDCSASFRTMKGLNDHATVHSNGVQCLVCQQTFEKTAQLTAHVITEHAQNPPAASAKVEKEALQPLYPCPHCTHVAESNEALSQHVCQLKNDRGWKCRFCPSTFRWKGSLDVHMARHEDEIKPCGHCGAVLTSKALLRAHVNAEHKLKFEVLTGAEAIAQAMGDIYAQS